MHYNAQRLHEILSREEVIIILRMCMFAQMQLYIIGCYGMTRGMECVCLCVNFSYNFMSGPLLISRVHMNIPKSWTIASVCGMISPQLEFQFLDRIWYCYVWLLGYMKIYILTDCRSEVVFRQSFYLSTI